MMSRVLFSSCVVGLSLVISGWSGNSLVAQELNVTTAQQRTGEWVGNVRLRQQGDMVQIHSDGAVETLVPVADLAISPDRMTWGVIERGQQIRVRLFDGEANTVLEHELEFVDAADETLSLTILDNGTYVVRDNVANFTRHDLDGSILVRHSNFSGTTGGERPSEFVTDPFGLTSLYVIPEIQYGSNRGSMIRLLEGLGEEPRTILDLSDQTITHVSLSPDGRRILMITEMSDSGDRAVQVMDRFGNSIREFGADEEWIGGSISSSGEYLTLHSTSRVQSFRISNAERLGSSTVRGGEVQFAGYCPSREEMVILTGEHSAASRTVNEAVVQVVSLRERSLARESVPGGTLSWDDGLRPRLSCGSTTHKVEGPGRTIQIQPDF